jgi:HlyD family secretion protein
LFRNGTAWNVFVVEGGIVQRRTVQIGHRNAASAEVVDGIREGERIILHPGDRIVDGVQVIAKDRSIGT